VGSGVERVQAQVEEFSAAAQALEQVGYRLGEVELELSIPPRFIVHLHREAGVTDEAFQAVLANSLWCGVRRRSTAALHTKTSPFPVQCPVQRFARAVRRAADERRLKLPSDDN
jgi:hypothetical protein